MWEKYKDIARQNKLTATGKKLYKVRCSNIERSFADAKELRGYRYAQFRGLKYVQMQAYLTATCQNMKGYFLSFYYFLLFSFNKILKNIRVLRNPKGFLNTLKKVTFNLKMTFFASFLLFDKWS